MRVTPNEIVKKRLVKKYWLETRRMFVVVRSAVSDFAEHTDPERLKPMVENMLNENIKTVNSHLTGLWSDVGGRFALDTFTAISKEKGLNQDIEIKGVKDKLKTYQDRMRAYAAERSLQKARRILTTEAEAINTVIDKVINTAIADGLSIPNTRRLLQDELMGDTMTTIENWEAERIAITEVGSASNAGSWEAMQDMELEGVRKSWMSSGRENVRPSHQEYEDMGIVDLDYEYNTGLKYPQDPECELAEEVCNCHCTPIWEID